MMPLCNQQRLGKRTTDDRQFLHITGYTKVVQCRGKNHQLPRKFAIPPGTHTTSGGNGERQIKVHICPILRPAPGKLVGNITSQYLSASTNRLCRVSLACHSIHSKKKRVRLRVQHITQLQYQWHKQTS